MIIDMASKLIAVVLNLHVHVICAFDVLKNQICYLINLKASGIRFGSGYYDYSIKHFSSYLLA